MKGRLDEYFWNKARRTIYASTFIGIFVASTGYIASKTSHIEEYLNPFPTVVRQIINNPTHTDAANFCVKGHQLPNVILFGSQKCGTSTVAHHLFQEPTWDAAVNAESYGFADYFRKEPHFFDNDNKMLMHNENYTRLFPPCGKYQNVFDGTPEYSRVSDKIAAMYDESQKQNIIFIKTVCNPVKRFESAWNHICSNNGWCYPKDESPDAHAEWAMANQETHVNAQLTGGHYDDELVMLRQYFPNNVLIILENTYFYQNQGQSMAKIFEITGTNSVNDIENVRINTADEHTKKKIKLGQRWKQRLRHHYDSHMMKFKYFLQTDKNMIMIPNDIDEFMKLLSD